MKIIATIAERAAAAGLPFLIIGGNAVVAHGYQRYTQDIDLLVRQHDLRAWDSLILPLGYFHHHVARVFVMYSPTEAGRPPIDFMLVDDSTFQKLASGAIEVELEGARIRIPALVHLIALKLHALRHGGEHRRERDLGDVLELLQINHVDLAAPEYCEILDRYATEALRAEIHARLARPESPDS